METSGLGERAQYKPEMYRNQDQVSVSGREAWNEYVSVGYRLRQVECVATAQCCGKIFGATDGNGNTGQ